MTHNPLGPGSNPGGPTIDSVNLPVARDAGSTQNFRAENDQQEIAFRLGLRRPCEGRGRIAVENVENGPSSDPTNGGEQGEVLEGDENTTGVNMNPLGAG